MARITKISRRVPSTPSDIKSRLREQTRFSLVPHQGSFLTLGDKPLRGRVAATRFTVGLNRRDWIGLLQPTARGRLTATGSGTRVDVVVGPPPALLWYLRIVVALFLPMFLLALATTVFATSAPISAVALTFGVLAFLILVSVVGIGVNMNNADGQVDALCEHVEAALEGTAAPARQPQGEPQRARVAHRPRERSPTR